MKGRSAVFLMTFVLAAAGAWAEEDKPPQFSGFLKDYSQLHPAKDRESVWLYIDKSADYRPYTKIILDPVEVILTPNPDFKGVQPDTLKRMSDDFIASYKKALTPGYQIVTEPGPDVLRLRAAITNVQLVKTSIGVTDVLPIKIAFNVARSAAGASPRLAQMTAEMEVLDAQGHRAAAAVAVGTGKETVNEDQQVTSKELEAITDHWAKGFRQRLDELRGVAAK